MRSRPACLEGDADHELIPSDEEGVDVCRCCGTEFIPEGREGSSE